MRYFSILTKVLLLSFFCSSSVSWALSVVEAEALYDSYSEQIAAGKSFTEVPINEEETKIFTDAIWDSIEAGETPFNSFLQVPGDISHFSFADRVRFELLKNWPSQTELPQNFRQEFSEKLANGSLDERAKMTLLGHQDLITDAEFYLQALQSQAPEEVRTFNAASQFRPKNSDELRDLVFNVADVSGYKDGRYTDAVRLFVFCRYNRVYKCLMMMTDKNGKLVMESDGQTPWSHPALGMSRLHLPSWKRNGNTPEGVFTVDGVMPSATKPEIFGKFRRLILNFLPKSADEALNKAFLPESAQDKNWWKSGVVARDIGRDMLRIHGSGIKRARPQDPHYPLRPTLGCIMQRELKFDGVDYKDQRKLLDKLMETSNLDVKYENETKILGLLYVIELDKQAKSVTLEEMKEKLEL